MAESGTIAPPSEMLRHASGGAHESTEQVPLLAKLATGGISDSDYARVMATFAALFEAIVLRIQAIPNGHRILALTDVAARARLARNDFENLDSEAMAGHGPGALLVSFIRGSGSALGALYALEGARLGATLIGSRLRSAGRPMGAAGYTFFEMSGVPVAREWRAFKTQLDRLLTNPDEFEEAVLGARGVFDLTAVVFAEPVQ
jgi:heme oxygenase